MGWNEQKLMNIGRTAAAVGVPTTTLRYYEREGIVRPAARSRAGYRLYDAEALARLEFIRAAKGVGFTLDDIRALLRLDGESPCKEVQQVIERRLADIDARLADLRRVRQALTGALTRCRKSKTKCAVLADLKKPRAKRRT